MSKGKTLGVADPDDILKTQTSEIAKYWRTKTGNVLSYTMQDVIRLVVSNYHRELLGVKPMTINLSNLFTIAS